MHRLLRLQQLAHAAGSSCQVQGSKVPLKVQAPLQGGVPVGSMAKAKVHRLCLHKQMPTFPVGQPEFALVVISFSVAQFIMLRATLLEQYRQARSRPVNMRLSRCVISGATLITSRAVPLHWFLRLGQLNAVIGYQSWGLVCASRMRPCRSLSFISRCEPTNVALRP